MKLATDRLDGRGGGLRPIDRVSDQSVLRLGRIIAAHHKVRHLSAPVVAKLFDSRATIIRAAPVQRNCLPVRYCARVSALARAELRARYLRGPVQADDGITDR